MRTLIPLLFALTSFAATADAPKAILDIKTRCIASGTAIELRFDVRNLGDRTIWIYPDTEPWSPAFRSNRFSAQLAEGTLKELRGPLAFGHSVEAVKVPANGSAQGVIQLHYAFPEIVIAAANQPVRLSWQWQGLASFSEQFEEISPTTPFEGSVSIHAGDCTESITRRLSRHASP